VAEERQVLKSEKKGEGCLLSGETLDRNEETVSDDGIGVAKAAEDQVKISLRNDIIFKYVFGHEKNERILRALLNALLGLEGSRRIVQLTFLNPSNLKEYLEDKHSFLDVKAQDSTGKRYNIEMQVRAESSYISRVIYYHDRLFTDQFKEGAPFRNLEKTLSISILNFVLLKPESELHNIYRYGNIVSGLELTDIKELHFVELPKFKKEKPRQLMTKFEKWLYVLKYGEKYTDNPDRLPDTLKIEEEIVMAIRKMREATKDDMVRALMESRQMTLHIEAERLCEAEQRGMEKGIEKGIEKGRQEGIEQGIHENSLKTARTMKENGFDTEIIMKMTCLTREEIEIL